MALKACDWCGDVAEECACGLRLCVECFQAHACGKDDVPERLPSPDPFAPPRTPVQVRCIHCETEYRSDAMVQGDDGLWRCGMPGCDGRGFEFDVWRVRD